MFSTCYACDRDFSSWRALEQHRRDSNRHNLCPSCAEDLPSAEDLRQHRREEHKYCSRCCCDLDYELSYGETVWDHEVEKHNRCDVCGEFFLSESNLRNHKRIHAPRNVECYGENSGCRRKFDCVSAMMLHLEGGRCPSDMDLERVDKLAFFCYQRRHYTNDKDDFLKYRCPTCGQGFSKMSALLQHAESLSCNEDVEDWPLCKVLHFIDLKT